MDRESHHSTSVFANVFMMQSKKNIDPDNEQIRIKHKLWLTGNNRHRVDFQNYPIGWK